MGSVSTTGIAIAAAAAAGLLGGAAFFGLWHAIVPAAFRRRFWRALPLDVRGVLASQDPDVMLVHYKALLGSLMSFAGRTTLGVGAGLAPMALLYLAMTAYDPSSALATQTEVYPASAVPDRLPAAVRRDDHLLVDRDADPAASLRLAGLTLEPALDDKVAICASPLACLVPGMLLFETRAARPRQAGMIVVRPRWFDANPLWPYLNDLDLSFFAAAVIGSAAAAAWAARRKDARE